MTPFALLLRLSCMSQREAADFLGVSPSSIDKMSRGARPAPEGVIEQMRDLIELQVTTAEKHAAHILPLDIDQIELGYPADDHEAQDLGFPCVGAWAGMAAQIVAALDIPIVLVPRGSTPGTAAAMDAHEKPRRHP